MSRYAPGKCTFMVYLLTCFQQFVILFKKLYAFSKKMASSFANRNMLHRHVSRDNDVICKQSSEAAKILFLQILVLYCSCRFSLRVP